MQYKPLNGIRILEIGGYISTPYGSSLLCALGAEVVKVEKPGAGDDFRRHQDDGSPYFMQYNAGKRSLSVDIKRPEGVALVKDLVPRFDVVMENLRPGKMDAIGLGRQACTALRSDLVYSSVTGFGNGGPLEQRPAYDAIGQAASGLHTVLSDAGSAQLSGTCLADLITGLANATGVLAALVGRGDSGGGQHVETSMMEAVSAITIDALTQYYDNGHRSPSRQSRHPQGQNFCIKTATGEDIVIHLSSSEKFWASFIDAMDRGDLADDPRFATFQQRMEHYFELADIVESEFANRPASEWEQRLTDADVPFSPAHTMAEFVDHPQTDWLDLLEPEHGGVSLMRPPWRFDGSRPRRDDPTPKVGQDTRDVAGEIYDSSRVDELLATGVLFASD